MFIKKLAILILSGLAGFLPVLIPGGPDWERDFSMSWQAKKSTSENISMELVQISQGHVASLRITNHSTQTILMSLESPGSTPFCRLRQHKFMAWFELDTSRWGCEETKHLNLAPQQSHTFDLDLSKLNGVQSGSGLFQVGVNCISRPLSQKTKIEKHTVWSPPIWSE